MNRRSQCLCRSCRIPRHARDDEHARSRVLRVRPVHCRPGILIEATVPDRPDNPDDLDLDIGLANPAYPATQRMAVWSQPLRHELVDHGDKRRFGGIGRRQRSALDQLNAHGLEVAGGDAAKVAVDACRFSCGIDA